MAKRRPYASHGSGRTGTTAIRLDAETKQSLKDMAAAAELSMSAAGFALIQIGIQQVREGKASLVGYFDENNDTTIDHA